MAAAADMDNLELTRSCSTLNASQATTNYDSIFGYMSRQSLMNEESINDSVFDLGTDDIDPFEGTDDPCADAEACGSSKEGNCAPMKKKKRKLQQHLPPPKKRQK